MLKKLTVHLKSGVLSKFDSDTTLGIFCWRLKHLHSEEKLKAFLELYRSGKPVFTISNELFEIDKTIFFPQPCYVPLSKTERKTKAEKIGDMLEHKEIRSQNLISLRQMNAFLNGDFSEYNKREPDIYADKKMKKKLTPGFTSELRVGVEIDRESFKSKESQLFSNHPKYLKEGNKLVFLIKVLDENAFVEFDCENVLKDGFEIGYGKKKSSGYGHCMVISFSNFNEIKEPDHTNGFISLSNYLPAKTDSIISGRYDTHVKYGKLGEELALSKIPFKKPMIMIKPGAIFFTEKQQEYYGRVTVTGEASTANPFVVQFGIPFTLNAKIK